MAGELEPRLEKDAAEAFFVAEFQKRLTIFKGLDEGDGWCWVIPFHYYDETDELADVNGGLWIPSLETQDLVSRAGAYIHYRLDADLQWATMKVEPRIEGPFVWGMLDYSGQIPVVSAPGAVMGYIDSLREQVEAVYGVRVEASEI